MEEQPLKGALPFSHTTWLPDARTQAYKGGRPEGQVNFECPHIGRNSLEGTWLRAKDS